MTYRGSISDPGGRAGLTTVELLIVLGIIGIVLSVSVPILLRMGLFADRRAELGGRELFTMLRAAKVYATTYNMEAAVVYGIDKRADSATGEFVPIVDSYAIVRRIQEQDLAVLELGSPVRSDIESRFRSDPIYVPVGGAEGSFKRLENETCILPDIFEVQQLGTAVISLTGLSDIQVVDLEGQIFFTPRRPELDYDVKAGSLIGSFPAHGFLPSGQLDIADIVTRQRLKLRVGLFPDADVLDRFVEEPNAAVAAGTASVRGVPIAIDRDEVTTLPIFIQGPDANDPDADELAIDLDIHLFPALGRVKVAS